MNYFVPKAYYKWKTFLHLNINKKSNVMTVKFQYVGVDVSETLSDFTEEKLTKTI